MLNHPFSMTDSQLFEELRMQVRSPNKNKKLTRNMRRTFALVDRKMKFPNERTRQRVVTFLTTIHRWEGGVEVGTRVPYAHLPHETVTRRSK